MDLKLIEELLNSYYEGGTTLEEEKILNDFFCGQSVPDHLKGDQAVFLFYTTASKESLNSFSVSYPVARTIPDQRSRSANTRPLFKISAAIAAGILVLLGTALFTHNYNTQQQRSSLVNSNDLLAYATTKSALLRVSDNLNKGNQSIYRIAELSKIQNSLPPKNK